MGQQEKYLAEKFWNRFDDIRLKIGRSIKAVAEMAGIPYEEIRVKRTRKRLPNIYDANSLAGALNISVDYLIRENSSNNIYQDPILEKSYCNPKLHAIFVYYAEMSDDKIDSYYNAFGLDAKEKRNSEKSAT